MKSSFQGIPWDNSQENTDSKQSPTSNWNTIENINSDTYKTLLLFKKT